MNLLAGCATEVHRSTCSCDLQIEAHRCTIEHEEHSFKKRPLGEKILDAIGSAVSAVLP